MRRKAAKAGEPTAPRRVKRVPRGAPIQRTEEERDVAAAIESEDIAIARAYWPERSRPVWKKLLDATADESEG